jgi:hypothetical protein
LGHFESAQIADWQAFPLALADSLAILNYGKSHDELWIDVYTDWLRSQMGCGPLSIERRSDIFRFD